MAEAIAGYLATAEVMDVSGRRHKGLLDGDDLAGWRATVEAPVSAEHRGWTVCKTGPWGQGPVLLQQLRLLDGFDLEAMGLGSAAYVHTVAECAKLAFADREAWYGDPAAFDVPLDGLLDPAYADGRRALVGDRGVAGAATRVARPGAPPACPRPGRGQAADEAVGPRAPGSPPSATPATSTWSTGTATWSRPPRAAAGCRARRSSPASASAWARAPRCSGWRRGWPARCARGTRPRTTLSPSLALRDGEPCLAFGTPGGDAQDQWTLQFFLAHARFGLDLQEAIDAPSFQSDHFPSSFWPRRALPGQAGGRGQPRPGHHRRPPATGATWSSWPTPGPSAAPAPPAATRPPAS